MKKRNQTAPIGVCRTYKRSLNKQFGYEKGYEIFILFLSNYKKIYKTRLIFPNKMLNRHLTKNILPGIALYDALNDKLLSGKEALLSMDAFYKIYYHQTQGAYRLLGKIPFFFSVLRGLTARSMSATYPKEGWTTDWIENSRDKIAFNVSKCFYQDILKTYDREELLKCFCQVDDNLFSKISPNVSWERSSTLGRCGEMCDFSFIRKKG